MKKNNAEMQEYLIANYCKLACTRTYAIGVKTGGRVYLAIVNNFDPLMRKVTYCAQNAGSHGAEWALRIDNVRENMELILAAADKVVEIGTYKEFEKAYAEYRKENNGNRGNYLEVITKEYFHGTTPKAKNEKFTNSGDVITPDGVHVQCKFCNATFTTLATINRMLAAAV